MKGEMFAIGTFTPLIRLALSSSTMTDAECLRDPNKLRSQQLEHERMNKQNREEWNETNVVSKAKRNM